MTRQPDHDPPPMPGEVKLVIALVVCICVVDVWGGLSTAAVVVAKLVLAAGVARGLEVFRYLLALSLAVTLPVALLMLRLGPIRGASSPGDKLLPIVLEIVATALALVLLRSSQVRAWFRPTGGRSPVA